MDADNAVYVCKKCGAKNIASQEHLHCRRCYTPFIASARKPLTVNVSDIDFAREVLASPSPVLLMMWAPWCAYCRILDPIFESIAAEYKDHLKVGRLNVDDNPAASSQYVVQGVPTILIFKDGKLMNKLVGVLSKEEIERQMQAVLKVNSGNGTFGS